MHADLQKRVLEAQLQIAVEMGKPVVIHCRDAEEDCREIVAKVRYLIHTVMT